MGIEFSRGNAVPPLRKAEAHSPPDDAALKNVCARVDEAVSRLGNVIQRVDNIGQYLYGPIPEPTTSTACSPVSAGIVPSLLDSVGALHSLISQLNDKLDRVSQL